MPREGMEGTEFVSGHRFRWTARRAEKALENDDPGNQYRVIQTKRGPHRYHVRRVVVPVTRHAPRPPGRVS